MCFGVTAAVKSNVQAKLKKTDYVLLNPPYFNLNKNSQAFTRSILFGTENRDVARNFHNCFSFLDDIWKENLFNFQTFQCFPSLLSDTNCLMHIPQR